MRQHWLQRQIPRRPELFRQILRLREGSPRRLGDLLQPWQQQDFLALDAAWKQLALRNGLEEVQAADRSAPSSTAVAPAEHHQTGNPPARICQRAWIERPRGHAKTSDLAVQLAWVLRFARQQLTGLAAAADLDQAGLIRDAVAQLVRANPRWLSSLVVRRWQIENEKTGSVLKVISSDADSSYGALPDFVVCDELCHWEREDLWHSLLSASAKQRHCVLVVLTNAGVGRGWHWEARERIRQAAATADALWHFSSLPGPCAPWIDSRLLDEQQQLLPRPVYERLWENRWQESDGEYVTLAEADACCDAQWTRQTCGVPGRHYVAAVDYAEKHDYTVGVVLHAEQPADGHSQLIVDRMDVTVPRPDAPTPVKWVEDWITEVQRNFKSVTFVLDEWQLLGVIQQTSAFADVRRFAFAAGEGNHRLAVTLRKLILEQRLRWYPGCGQLEECATRDDLATELAALVLRQSASGRCRIDHRRDRHAHDDRAFALGAACLTALEQPAQAADLQITWPHPDGTFAWESGREWS